MSDYPSIDPQAFLSQPVDREFTFAVTFKSSKHGRLTDFVTHKQSEFKDMTVRGIGNMIARQFVSRHGIDPLCIPDVEVYSCQSL